MLKILDDQTIQLTRGDTAALTINIVDEVTSAPYEVVNDDKLTFSVKKTVNDRNYYVKKTVTGTNHIVINPSDTKNMGFGTYVYDVQLDKADGEASTVIGPATFELLTEVTW